jgi:tRNA pseudouridine55 synthase
VSSPTAYHGIVVVDKPSGMTSHDVVGMSRRLFQTKRVGHTGTLDPDATGVLVLCVGQATRLAEYLTAARKHYITNVVFGVETDTQDASGQILAERNSSHLTEATVRELLLRFQGTIQQIPPMVSARHHQGQRLYELARQGITVEREARAIQIDRLELTDFQPGVHPVATLEVTCSTGTYIRTLAADLGTAGGTGGMMQALRRTWVGQSAENAFTLEEAYTLERLREYAGCGRLCEVVLPVTAALRSWIQVRLSSGELACLRQGQAVPLAESTSVDLAGQHPQQDRLLVVILDDEGNGCAIARMAAGRLQPVKVFNEHEAV